MLRFHTVQIEELDRISEQDFLQNLQRLISRRHPELLMRFPPNIRRIIVTNMISRARAIGATWQSSLVKLCLMMETFAPNFLEDEKVRSLIAREPDSDLDDPIDQNIERLHFIMREADWLRVERNRSELPLYTDAASDSLPLDKRIARALPVVLWDHVSDERSEELAAKAVQWAHDGGLGTHEDAALALAGWHCLYPANAKPDWQSDVRDRSRYSSERLEMLRCRIMLDFGRRI